MIADSERYYSNSLKFFWSFSMSFEISRTSCFLCRNHRKGRSHFQSRNKLLSFISCLLPVFTPASGSQSLLNAYCLPVAFLFTHVGEEKIFPLSTLGSQLGPCNKRKINKKKKQANLLNISFTWHGAFVRKWRAEETMKPECFHSRFDGVESRGKTWEGKRVWARVGNRETAKSVQIPLSSPASSEIRILLSSRYREGASYMRANDPLQGSQGVLPAPAVSHMPSA